MQWYWALWQANVAEYMSSRELSVQTRSIWYKLASWFFSYKWPRTAFLENTTSPIHILPTSEKGFVGCECAFLRIFESARWRLESDPHATEILSLTSLGKMQMKCCRLRLHCTLCFFVLTVLLLLPKFIWRCCFLLKIFLWFCQRSCFYKKINNVFRPFPSTSRTESISFVKADLNPKNSRTLFQCSKDIHTKYKWNAIFVLQKWVSFWNMFCYKTLKYFQKCFANAFCSNLCIDTIWFKKRQIISNYQLKIINAATWYGHLW